MIKIIFLIVSFLSVIHADIINFYKSAVQNLQYDKAYSLYKQSATLSQDALVYSQYADLSLDASYTNTKAKLLQSSFNTSDISISDTFDIFNKKSYFIDAIASDIKSQRYLLQNKKEQLFQTLVSMIALYHALNQKIMLNQKLYDEQKSLYDKLFILQEHGAISKLDLLRFKNTLTQLQTKIIRQKNNLAKMDKQLNLYAPKQNIPNLDSKIRYSKKSFLSHNPLSNANEAMAEKSLAEAKALGDNYLPELTVGMAYQKLDDPTSYGNNYSFNLALHIPLNSSDQKEAEALKAKALSQESHKIELQLQRENQYIALLQNYESANKQLQVLQSNLNDYIQSQQTVKAAFVKQYVDFNSYLQVLSQTLHIQEQIIDLQQQRNQNATFINSIAAGVLYE